MATTHRDGEMAIDGRRARRERGRRAVIDAVIDLIREGVVPPMVEQIVERAGVSQASLFRYFATLDDLRREAIGRYFERFDDLIEIPDIGEGDLAARVERFVSARDRFYVETAPMARLARRQAAEVEQLAATIERVRATFAAQIAQHFAPELAGLARPLRAQRVAVLAALTSFEAWDQLADLGPRRRPALIDAVTTLLAPVARS